ncbi:MAG: cupredoxin domain-containing protein, partial [Crocinitomicaceae bacterium]
MKRNIAKIIGIVAISFSAFQLSAQTENIKLTQTEGAFETTELTLNSGDYLFEIENDGVDREVGFVLVPEGKYDAMDHIKEAYVKAPVANGSSSMTNVVSLAPGTYEYFCPLNPTPKYTLTVVDKVETIKLAQTPGKFTKKKVKVSPGNYQFEIAND